MIRRRWCWLELCHVIVTVVSSVTQCHEPPPPVAKILRVSVWCGVAGRGQGRAVRSSFARFLHGAECGAAARCGGHSPRFAENLQCGCCCCCVRAAVLRWTGGGAGADCTVRQQPIAALHCLHTARCAAPTLPARRPTPGPCNTTPTPQYSAILHIARHCDPEVQIK